MPKIMQIRSGIVKTCTVKHIGLDILSHPVDIQLRMLLQCFEWHCWLSNWKAVMGKSQIKSQIFHENESVNTFSTERW